MDVLDQEDIGWLLTNYIHDDLKNDKDVIEKSLPVKIMLSHGGECFYDCSEVLNIVSNEQIKLFEGTVIRETNKEDGLKTISELKDQSLDWRHLSYQNYRLIVDEKKTEYLKALVFLKDSDPLEFYKKVIKIYKIKDLECIY